MSALGSKRTFVHNPAANFSTDNYAPFSRVFF